MDKEKKIEFEFINQWKEQHYKEFSICIFAFFHNYFMGKRTIDFTIFNFCFSWTKIVDLIEYLKK